MAERWMPIGRARHACARRAAAVDAYERALRDALPGSRDEAIALDMRALVALGVADLSCYLASLDVLPARLAIDASARAAELVLALTRNRECRRASLEPIGIELAVISGRMDIVASLASRPTDSPEVSKPRGPRTITDEIASFWRAMAVGDAPALERAIAAMESASRRSQAQADLAHRVLPAKTLAAGLRALVAGDARALDRAAGLLLKAHDTHAHPGVHGGTSYIGGLQASPCNLLISRPVTALLAHARRAGLDVTTCSGYAPSSLLGITAAATSRAPPGRRVSAAIHRSTEAARRGGCQRIFAPGVAWNRIMTMTDMRPRAAAEPVPPLDTLETHAASRHRTAWLTAFLATMDPPPKLRRMEMVAIPPGVTVEEVRRQHAAPPPDERVEIDWSVETRLALAAHVDSVAAWARAEPSDDRGGPGDHDILAAFESAIVLGRMDAIADFPIPGLRARLDRHDRLPSIMALTWLAAATDDEDLARDCVQRLESDSVSVADDVPHFQRFPRPVIARLFDALVAGETTSFSMDLDELLAWHDDGARPRPAKSRHAATCESFLVSLTATALVVHARRRGVLAAVSSPYVPSGLLLPGRR